VHIALVNRQVREPGQAGAGLGHDLGRQVDAVDLAGVGGQQLGHRTVTRGDVDDPPQGGQPDQTPGDGFPGAAWRVVTGHLSRHAVGPASVALSGRQDRLHAAGVLGQQRVIGAVQDSLQQG